MKNKFRFLSLSQKGGKAKFRMTLPFDGGQLSMGAAVQESILDAIRLAAAEVGKQTESLGVGVASQWGAQPAPIQFETVDELLPKETDYYYKDYRAISATLAPCFALDFSAPGVLEASVEMLKGQTVYKDHYYYSVDHWVGVVSEVSWDAKGENAGGVPGILARLKLDAKKDPMLVRGVAMSPPAVHSCSVTVLFEFEFSHPDLVEQGRFWQLLGEEIEGQIVRLIVTAILGYWELSLVFQGAQEENKQQPALPSVPGDVEIDDEDDAELAHKRKTRMSAGANPPVTHKEKTKVKLNQTRKTALGITSDGEEFEDELVLQAIDSLATRATNGDTLQAARRAECLRLATIAECGSEEGQLDASLAAIINDAQGDKLEGLITMYTKKAGAQFTATCPKCGEQGLKPRSSVEDRTGQPMAAQPSYVPNGANAIHA